MSDSRKYSGLTKQVINVPPYSVATLEYSDTIPNYYRVQNSGDSKIFCGTSHIPTADRYDFAVNAGRIKLYGEPFRKTNLFIYNPAGSQATVTVVSFFAEFDPATLALSDLEIDLSDTVLETSTVISSFNSPLPQGSNKLGVVGVDNFPMDYAKERNQKDYTEILGDILNAVGNSGGGGATITDYAKESKQKDYTQLLGDILSAVGNINAGGSEPSGGGEVLSEILTTLQDLNRKNTYEVRHLSGTVPDEGYSESFMNMTIKFINFLSNDGDCDILFQLTSNSVNSLLRIKPGEVLENIPCNLTQIRMATNGPGQVSTFRMVYQVLNKES